MTQYNGITELTYSCGHTRQATSGWIFAPLTEHWFDFPCSDCRKIMNLKRR